MAFEGKLVKSRRKALFSNEHTVGFAPKKLAFANQMTAGQTDIDLTSLTLPSGMNGFTNSPTIDLLAAHIYAYQNNVSLRRSDGGELIQGLEFKVINDSVIRLMTPAQNGTIVYGTIDTAPMSGNVAVDGFQIVSTGTLAVGQTDVVVGMPFQLFANPSQQIGSIMVFRNGKLMARNDANVTASPTAPGNYQELPTGVGLSNTIRFNRAGITLQDGSSESYLIVSNGIVAMAPSAQVFGVLDSFGGQMDKVITALAPLAGQPKTYFQANPNQIDLRIFGDRVLALETPIRSEVYVNGGGASGLGTGNGFGSTNTYIRYMGQTIKNVGTAITYNHDTTLGDSYVINETGLYAISYTEYALTGGSNFGISVNSTALTSRIDTASNDSSRIAFSFAASAVACNLSTTLELNQGDVVRPHTDANGSTNGLLSFRITKVNR